VGLLVGAEVDLMNQEEVNEMALEGKNMMVQGKVEMISRVTEVVMEARWVEEVSTVLDVEEVDLMVLQVEEMDLMGQKWVEVDMMVPAEVEEGLVALQVDVVVLMAQAVVEVALIWSPAGVASLVEEGLTVHPAEGASVVLHREEVALLDPISPETEKLMMKTRMMMITMLS